MKKIISLICITVLSALSAGGVEILKESFDHAGWTSWKSDAACGTFSHDLANGKGAKGALKITAGPGNPLSEGMVFVKNDIPVTPGKRYRARVFVRCDGMISGRIGMAFQGVTQDGAITQTGLIGKVAVAAEMAKKSDWHKLETVLVVPDRTDKLLCSLALENCAEGTVWFDDFVFEEAENFEYCDGFESLEWNSWKSPECQGRFDLNMSQGRTGKGALEITVDSDSPKGLGFVFSKVFPAEPGKNYTATVYVKKSQLSRDALLSLAFQGVDKEGKFLGNGVYATDIRQGNFNDGEWRRMVYTLRIPTGDGWENVGGLLCSMGVSETTMGNVFFDDFEFFEEDHE